MTAADDTYQTIEAPVEGLYKDKGSKFIGYAYPLANEEEVKQYVAELRELHPKARHYCWAYRLSPDRTVFRVNDDGEPSGSAGKPILNTLLSNNLTNVLVVVVRYFGGTLLGVPGLINAYKQATQEAIHQATVVEKTVNEVYRIDFDYLQMNDVMRVMKDDNVRILNQQFDNQCSLEFMVRKALGETIIGKLEKTSDISVTWIATV